MRPVSPLLRSLAGLALALLAPIPALPAQTPGPLLHQPAPQFVRSDLNHRRIDLSNYRGKVVLLTFWATWCAPCQIEMPRFVQWQGRYGAAGLQIIGVSMDDDSAPVLALTRKRRVNYPIVMGDAQLGELYGGVLGLPVIFLIDRQGNIAARFQGETELGRIERELQRLLRAPGQ